VSRIGLGFLLTLALLTAGCGYGSHYMGGGGGGAPNIIGLAPNMKNAGDPAFTLTVNGSGFGTDAVVYWNGTAIPSSYSTSSSVSAQVAADLMSAGMFPVYVRSGGKNSNLINFTVQ
jgi:hypothetical protein